MFPPAMWPQAHPGKKGTVKNFTNQWIRTANLNKISEKTSTFDIKNIIPPAKSHRHSF